MTRYGITRPVINGADLHLWQQHAVKAWPALVLVNPEGYVVAQAAGEGYGAAFGELLDELVPTHATRGALLMSEAVLPAPEPEA